MVFLYPVLILAYFATDEAILLGFQHYIVMLGTIVIIATALVPQMGGGNVRLRIEIYVLQYIYVSCLIPEFNSAYFPSNYSLEDHMPNISYDLPGPTNYQRLMSPLV